MIGEVLDGLIGGDGQSALRIEFDELDPAPEGAEGEPEPAGLVQKRGGIDGIEVVPRGRPHDDSTVGPCVVRVFGVERGRGSQADGGPIFAPARDGIEEEVAVIDLDDIGGPQVPPMGRYDFLVPFGEGTEHLRATGPGLEIVGKMGLDAVGGGENPVPAGLLNDSGGIVQEGRSGHFILNRERAGGEEYPECKGERIWSAWFTGSVGGWAHRVGSIPYGRWSGSWRSESSLRSSGRR